MLTDIQYKLKNMKSRIETSSNSNGILNIDNGRVALQTDKKGKRNAIITVGGKASRANNSDLPVQQDLTLSADFIFSVKLAENENFSEEKFKQLTQDYALSFCVIKIQEIVKNITSLDYGSPIVVRDFDLPSGITIFREG